MADASLSRYAASAFLREPIRSLPLAERFALADRIDAVGSFDDLTEADKDLLRKAKPAPATTTEAK